jgi:hypothetical protein
MYLPKASFAGRVSRPAPLSWQAPRCIAQTCRHICPALVPDARCGASVDCPCSIECLARAPPTSTPPPPPAGQRGSRARRRRRRCLQVPKYSVQLQLRRSFLQQGQLTSLDADAYHLRSEPLPDVAGRRIRRRSGPQRVVLAVSQIAACLLPFVNMAVKSVAEQLKDLANPAPAGEFSQLLAFCESGPGRHLMQH